MIFHRLVFATCRDTVDMISVDSVYKKSMMEESCDSPLSPGVRRSTCSSVSSGGDDQVVLLIYVLIVPLLMHRVTSLAFK